MSIGPGSPSREWSEALSTVSGHQVDLRALCNGSALIDPSVVLVTKGGRDGSSIVMETNRGQPAIERFVQEMDDLSELMVSVESARLELMDIEALRRAGTLARHQSTALSEAKGTLLRLSSETASPSDGSEGEYRRSLDGVVQQMLQQVSNEAERYGTGPPPVITGMLEEAERALRAFGERMAGAFFDAQPELVKIATTFWDGVNTNLLAYWQARGWGPGGPNSVLFDTDPAEAETQWRATVASYSSEGLPGLPEGTPVVTADLTNGWPAFGQALTVRLGQILDRMDKEAEEALSDLEWAYVGLILALESTQTGEPVPRGNTPGALMVMGGMTVSPLPTERPLSADGTPTVTPGIPQRTAVGVPDGVITPEIPSERPVSTNGTPMVTLGTPQRTAVGVPAGMITPETPSEQPVSTESTPTWPPPASPGLEPLYSPGIQPSYGPVGDPIQSNVPQSGVSSNPDGCDVVE